MARNVKTLIVVLMALLLPLPALGAQDKGKTDKPPLFPPGRKSAVVGKKGAAARSLSRRQLRRRRHRIRRRRMMRRLRKRIRMFRFLRLGEELRLSDKKMLRLSKLLRGFDNRKHAIKKKHRGCSRTLIRSVRRGGYTKKQVAAAVKCYVSFRDKMSALRSKELKAVLKELAPSSHARYIVASWRIRRQIRRMVRRARRRRRLRRRRRRRRAWRRRMRKRRLERRGRFRRSRGGWGRPDNPALP